MRDEYEEIKFQAGYPGEDSMRKKAEKLLADEFAMTPKNFPGSASANDREKVRLYKKGGSVKKHPMPKYQTDLVLPKLAKTPRLSVQSLQEAQKMKKGGSVSYETNMVGEKCVGRPSAKASPKIHKEGTLDASHGQYLKKGGRVKKMAAGGAAKVRHGVATSKGYAIR